MAKDVKNLRVPTNMTKEAAEHPIIPLVDAMAHGGTEGMITDQEARGQQSLVNSDTLPSEISGDGKEILEVAGVKFLGPVEDDNLFQYVELPSGWKKIPTDHDMWSNLVDDRGCIRAAIFYKGAFYDRKADMRACKRF